MIKQYHRPRWDFKHLNELPIELHYIYGAETIKLYSKGLEFARPDLRIDIS